MAGNPLAHLLQNVQPSALRLRQSLPHDLSGNAPDLNIHLQCGDAVFCPRDFEIHVAVVIFRPGDVGENGVIVPFLHQPHRHPRHRGLQRNPRIHQRKRSPANRRHGRRAIRFQNVRDYAHGVRPIFLRRKHGRDRSLRERSMPNFPASRPPQKRNLAHRERRKIVMQQEALFGFAFEGFEALLVVAGA